MLCWMFTFSSGEIRPPHEFFVSDAISPMQLAAPEALVWKQVNNLTSEHQLLLQLVVFPH